MAGFFIVIMWLGGIVWLIMTTLLAVALIVISSVREKKSPEKRKRYALARIIGYFMLVPAVGIGMVMAVFMIMR